MCSLLSGLLKKDTDSFKAALKSAKSLEELFTVVNNFYDTKAELQPIAKGTIIQHIDKFIAASGVKQKK